MATEETWEEIIRTNYTDLVKNIDTECGLIGELRKSRIFTPIVLKSITDCKDTTDRIDKLLQKIKMKDFESFKKFCEALNSNGQENIVKKYLSKVQDVSCRQVMTTDSPLNVDLPDNRAISDGMSECFKQYWNDLVGGITFDTELLTVIERRNIVTDMRLKKLRDMEKGMKRTEQMLHWLEGGSEKQFVDFCGALEDCKQSFIVTEYLTPKNKEAKIPESNIPEPKITEHVHVIPESNISHPDPPVIQKNPMKSPDVCRDSEGVAVVAPLPRNECGSSSAARDFCFSPCNEKFLKDVQDKVLKEAAYRCESKPRGRALIMNNMFFTNMRHRGGSDVDTEHLKALFTRLHFDTVVHLDKNGEEIWSILNEESKANHHKQYDMFVLFLMSHGIQGEIYGRDGTSLKTAAIVNLFNGNNCPHLLSKPKFFFIQACQGDVKTVGCMTTDAGMTAYDSAIPVQHQNAAMEKMLSKLCLEEDFKMSIPLAPRPEFESDAVADDIVHEMADMAIIYATVEGQVAWRGTYTGSLFVQCLINVLLEQAHETELLRMITEAFNRLHKENVNEAGTRYKQIGEKRDSLRKEVYLLPL